jgi:hypothetical protein
MLCIADHHILSQTTDMWGHQWGFVDMGHNFFDPRKACLIYQEITPIIKY